MSSEALTLKRSDVIFNSGMKISQVVPITVLVALLVVHLIFGTIATTHSEYSSGVGVFNEYMNGALRLLFPLVATLIAAVPIYNELNRNFIALTRTRVRLERHVMSLLRAGVARNCLYFGALGVTTTIAATFVAPALNPRLIRPHDYGLSAGQAAAQQAEQNPLGAAIGGGTLAYGLTATLWMVLASAIFSIVGVAAVLIVRRRALALLTPFAVLLVESIVAEVLGAPSYTLLLELPVPSSLQHFPLSQAVVPPVVLGLLAAIGCALWLRRSYRTGDFS